MELESASCKLVPLAEVHFSELIQMFLDCPECNEFIPGLRNKSPEEYREVLFSKMDRNKEYVGFWTVFSKENGAIIGTVNLYDYPGRDIIHIGLYLHRNFWGKGLGVELMDYLLNFGYTVRLFNEIHAVIDEKHAVSRKLFERLGFKIKDSFIEDGGTILIYSKSNPH